MDEEVASAIGRPARRAICARVHSGCASYRPLSLDSPQRVRELQAPESGQPADPDTGVTYVRTRYWDHSQSDAGCFCDGELDDSPVPFTAGTITIETSTIEGYVWSISLAGDLPPFTGSSSIPAPCGNG